MGEMAEAGAAPSEGQVLSGKEEEEAIPEVEKEDGNGGQDWSGEPLTPPTASADAADMERAPTSDTDLKRPKWPPRNKYVMRLLQRREVLFSLIGALTFLLGLILIVIALVIMQGKCDRQYAWSNEDGVYDTASNGNSDAIIVDGAQAPYYINPDNQTEDAFTNLAEGKLAFQSSTTLSPEGLAYNASLATDGRLDNRVDRGSCAQTEYQLRPYWSVDLQAVHTVGRVKLIIPGDCCGGDLHDFEIRVGQRENLEENRLCKHYMGSALKLTLEIQCDMPTPARYVSIQMLGDDTRPMDRLSLCEVQIYSR